MKEKLIFPNTPIECLLRWKYPSPYLGYQLQKEKNANSSEPKDIAVYRKKLEAMPEDALQALYQKEKIENEKRVAFLRNRIANPEANAFFNKPVAKADFKHWGKMPYWTLEEAIALTFGKNPEIVNWEKIKNRLQDSNFANEYKKIRDLATRAKNIKQLSDSVFPTNYIAWAKRNEITFPVELEAIVEQHAGQIADWQSLCEQQKQIIEQYQQRNQALKETVEELTQANQAYIEKAEPFIRDTLSGLEILAKKEKPVSTRERHTMLKMIICMAVKGYCYEPFSTKNTAATEISGDLAELGIPVSDDTVRKYLIEAVPLLPSKQQKS